jgi:hypothetical protein
MSNETVEGQPTVRFTGVNVQVVDGTGDTDGAVNGKGNLIVGYNENALNPRSGSHNLIVGDRHSYTSYGGFVAGLNNTISGPRASVAGGELNTASGIGGSVSGGDSNIASGFSSSVSGGSGNSAGGFSSSVSGGSGNSAGGDWSSVSNGLSNTAATPYESVVGGDDVFCSSIVNNNRFCGEGSPIPVDS